MTNTYLRPLLAFAAFIASLVLCSCNGNDEFTITVASELYVYSDCTLDPNDYDGIIVHLYKQDGSNNWKQLDTPIVDFAFERGYEVTMRVEEVHLSHPYADGSSKMWRVKKIISKEQKESEVGSGVKEVVWNPEEEKYYYKE